MTLAYSLRKQSLPKPHVIHVVDPGSLRVGRDGLTARWSCNPSPPRPHLAVEIDEVPDDENFKPCPRCDVSGIQQVPSVVYFAETADRYKVGTTTQMVERMGQLDAHLLAFKAGSFDEERSVLAALADHALPESREWFPRTVDMFCRISQYFPITEGAN